MAVHNCLFATMTSVGAYVVLRSVAAAHTVLVARFALAVVVVLGGWALSHAERPVAHVFALLALLGIRSVAGAVALHVTRLAGLLVRSINTGNTIARSSSIVIVIVTCDERT